MKANSFSGAFKGILAFLGALLLPALALAGGGKLVFVKGKLWLSRDGGRSWQELSAAPGHSFPEGVCLKLSRKAEAALLLSDGSQIRLHGGSIFCLNRTGPTPPARTGKRGVYKILKGKLWFRNKRQVPKPVFYTPSVVASIRGTEAYFEVEATERVAVLDGEVKVSTRSAQASQKARRGEVIQVEGGSLRVEKVLRPELLAQWLILVPEIRGPLDLTRPGPGTARALAAMKALFRWEIEEAERLSREAVELSPDRAAPYLARAFVLQARGRFQAALKMARKALSLDPASAPAAFRVVELLLAEDRLTEAEKVLARLRPKDKTDRASKLVLSGYLSLIKRQAPKAISSFEEALSLTPSSAYAWLGLGLARWGEGQEEKALEAMEKASLCAPFWAWPHLYLGRALYERRERHEALAELRRASQLDPNDPSPYWVMAVVYRDLFRPAEAIEALEKALALNDRRLAFRSRFLLDQDRALRNVSLALALEDLGLYTWAEARGNLAVWEAPNTAGAYYFRAASALERSAADPTTLADLRKAHLLSPPNANTYTTYQDYTHFFTKKFLRKGISAQINHNGDYDLRTYLYGGDDGLALSLQGDFYGSEGPVEGSERYLRQGLFRVKKALSPRTETLFEGVVSRFDRGDFLPWIYGRRWARDVHLIRDLAQLTWGFHHRFHAGSDLLAQAFYLTEDVSGFDTRAGFGEAVWHLRLGEHRLLLGGQHETRKEEGLYRHASRLELWDRWHLRPDLWLFAAAGYLYADLPRNWHGRHHLFGGGGLAWQRGENLLRAALFESAGVSTFSGTLLPSEMAGFDRFSSPDWGGGKDLFALGWDRFWGGRGFSRLEFYREKRVFRRPGFTDGTDLWTVEKRREVRAFWERQVGRCFGLGFFGSYLRLKAKGGFRAGPGNRYREDWTLRGTVTYYSPEGWRVQAALAYFDREKHGPWLDREGTHVLIPGVSVLRYLADRKGRLFFFAQAPIKDAIRYLPQDPFDLVNAPWPDFLAGAALIWEW